MKIEFDGIVYTPEHIEELRQDLIVYRDRAIENFPAGIEMSLVLSHTIAVLAAVKDELTPPPAVNVIVTVRRDAGIDEAAIRAQARHLAGIADADLSLVSVTSWTEPLDGMGPHPEYDLHKFTATQPQKG